MADTLTTLITKVQLQLVDDGTLFTTPTLTAALRQALADINQALPINAAITLPAVADQKEYELTDQDPTALQIIGVLRAATGIDSDIPLTYYAYNEDSP